MGRVAAGHRVRPARSAYVAIGRPSRRAKTTRAARSSFPRWRSRHRRTAPPSPTRGVRHRTPVPTRCHRSPRTSPVPSDGYVLPIMIDRSPIRARGASPTPPRGPSPSRHGHTHDSRDAVTQMGATCVTGTGQSSCGTAGHRIAGPAPARYGNPQRAVKLKGPPSQPTALGTAPRGPSRPAMRTPPPEHGERAGPLIMDARGADATPDARAKRPITPPRNDR